MGFSFRLSSVEPESVELEVWARPSDYVIGSWNGGTRSSKCGNGLFSAVFHSWASHHRLSLRPDDIWLAIITQLVSYFQKRKSPWILSRNLELNLDQPMDQIPLDQLVQLIIQQIVSCLTNPKILDWYLPNFTTSTREDIFSALITLIGQPYPIENKLDPPTCGIPEVRLEGTVNDWIQLQDKVKHLREYETETYHFYFFAWKGVLDRWLDQVDLVIQKLIQTVEEHPDVNWWDQVCDLPGSSCISGWLKVFSAFTPEGDYQGETKGIPIHQISSGVIQVPMILRQGGNQVASRLIAGQRGTEVEGLTLIRPRTDWYLILDPC